MNIRAALSHVCAGLWCRWEGHDHPDTRHADGTYYRYPCCRCGYDPDLDKRIQHFISQTTGCRCAWLSEDGWSPACPAHSHDTPEY